MTPDTRLDPAGSRPARTAWASLAINPATTGATVIGKTPRRSSGRRSAHNNRTVQPAINGAPVRIA